MVTRAEWDARWLERFNFYNREQGRSLDRSRERAWADTTHRYGPRPGDDKKNLRRLPWRYRILASWALKRAEKMLKGATGMWQKVGYAALYGVGAVFAALQASGIPKDEQGWIGLAGVFFITFWGKLTHAENAADPRRAIWTPEERAAKREREDG